MRDSSAARKIPDIDGLLVYRKDKQELFLRSNKTWNGLLQSSKVMTFKFILETLLCPLSVQVENLCARSIEVITLLLFQCALRQ